MNALVLFYVIAIYFFSYTWKCISTKNIVFKQHARNIVKQKKLVLIHICIDYKKAQKKVIYADYNIPSQFLNKKYNMKNTILKIKQTFKKTKSQK